MNMVTVDCPWRRRCRRCRRFRRRATRASASGGALAPSLSCAAAPSWCATAVARPAASMLCPAIPAWGSASSGARAWLAHAAASPTLCGGGTSPAGLCAEAGSPCFLAASLASIAMVPDVVTVALRCSRRDNGDSAPAASASAVRAALSEEAPSGRTEAGSVASWPARGSVHTRWWWPALAITAMPDGLLARRKTLERAQDSSWEGEQPSVYAQSLSPAPLSDPPAPDTESVTDSPRVRQSLLQPSPSDSASDPARLQRPPATLLASLADASELLSTTRPVGSSAAACRRWGVCSMAASRCRSRSSRSAAAEPRTSVRASGDAPPGPARARAGTLAALCALPRWQWPSTLAANSVVRAGAEEADTPEHRADAASDMAGVASGSAASEARLRRRLSLGRSFRKPR
mmetsp:Transcript_4568/g.19445  ORF Transcript_4568/g.19445 Transcript_4568/m.19445 type:complete len:404 (-) Transcript_4568:1341-2552(-)